MSIIVSSLLLYNILSCVTIITILFFFISLSIFIRLALLLISNADVGSSKSITSGFCNNCLIIDIFCFSPPEILFCCVLIILLIPLSNCLIYYPICQYHLSAIWEQCDPMLANKLGVSQRSISKYETAVLLPPPYVLVAMAKCFGITIDELLSETLPDKKGMKENE